MCVHVHGVRTPSWMCCTRCSAPAASCTPSTPHRRAGGGHASAGRSSFDAALGFFLTASLFLNTVSALRSEFRVRLFGVGNMVSAQESTSRPYFGALVTEKKDAGGGRASTVVFTPVHVVALEPHCAAAVPPMETEGTRTTELSPGPRGNRGIHAPAVLQCVGGCFT